MSLRAQADKLQQRRRALLALSDAQRHRLLRQSHETQALLHAVDVAVHVAGVVRRHPGTVLGGGLLVLALVRPHRFAAALRGLTNAMRTWGLFAPVLQRIAEARAA